VQTRRRCKFLTQQANTQDKRNTVAAHTRSPSTVAWLARRTQLVSILQRFLLLLLLLFEIIRRVPPIPVHGDERFYFLLFLRPGLDVCLQFRGFARQLRRAWNTPQLMHNPAVVAREEQRHVPYKKKSGPYKIKTKRRQSATQVAAIHVYLKPRNEGC